MPKIINEPVSAIKNAAKVILSEEGYQALSIRNVATKSGIGIGTVYNYYENKEALIIQLMSDYWNDYFGIIDDIDAKPISLYEKLAMIYDHFKSFTDDFHEIFLSQSFKPAYTSRTKANKVSFMIKLQERFSQMIHPMTGSKPRALSSDEIAEFILANFVSITYMPTYSYQKFEKALKAILE